MSELLFECYGVPGVSYGVDALLSYHSSHEGNSQHSQSGLIVSIGHQTIHIIPFLDGKMDVTHARRINIGGFHVTSYMHRLLQLKYPVHFNAVTLSRAEVCIQFSFRIKLFSDDLYFVFIAELNTCIFFCFFPLPKEIVHDHSFIPVDYRSVLNQWADPGYYDCNILRIQLPYAVPAAVSSLTADQQKERRKELAKRLVEINARKRDERVCVWPH